MLKRNQLITLITLLAVLLLAISTGSAQNETISKASLMDALKQLKRGDSQAAIVRIIQSRGVDFELTEETKSELTRVGATPGLIEAVRANYRKPATPNLVNDANLEMVWIPAGSFMMGAKNGPEHEKPLHRVNISQGFYMGKYEVTQAQWQSVMGDNPSHFTGDNLPVEQVSWSAAVSFVKRLNMRDSAFIYRLPTEAEWEYAARAGTMDDYAGQLDAMGWYVQNSGRLTGQGETMAVLRASDAGEYLRLALENGGRTHPVGSKSSNAFGLFDMHGNVWEWCEDSFHGDYSGAPTDGSAWLGGPHAQQHVLRGGSWIDLASWCRSAARAWELPNFSFTFHIGLRVVAQKRR